jgi:hypothetical protein
MPKTKALLDGVPNRRIKMPDQNKICNQITEKTIEARLQRLERPMGWSDLLIHPLVHLLDPGVPSKIEGVIGLVGRLSMGYIGYMTVKKGINFFTHGVKEEETEDHILLEVSSPMG